MKYLCDKCSKLCDQSDNVLWPGLYPEVHGIVGNQFYDSEVHKMTDSTYLAFFNIDDERTTAHMKWWQKVGESLSEVGGFRLWRKSINTPVVFVSVCVP